MEKLQPVITHIFWVLLGVALLLPTVGWWLGTGALETQITEQETKIDSNFNKNIDSPNQDWTTELQKINEQDQVQYDLAKRRLQGTQHQLRVWPDAITPHVQHLPYRGKIESTAARESYRQAYEDEIAALRKIVSPYDPETNTGKVILDPGTIPRVPPERWVTFMPESDEMWDAQEDIWLLRGLLKSIAEMNQGDTINDVTLRYISSITLHGGDRSAMGPGASTTTRRSDSDGYPSDYGRQFGGRSGQAGGGRSTPIDLNPETIFGPQQAQRTGTPSQDGETRPGGYGRQLNAPLDRYVDDEEGMPFKTRGFILKVVMDHRDVPDLLCALTNCEWPGQILHVNQVDAQRQGAPRSRTQMQGPAMATTNPYQNMFAGNTYGDYGEQEFDNEGYEPEGYEGNEEGYPEGYGEGPPGGLGANVGAILGRLNVPALGGRGTTKSSAAAAMADPYLAQVVVGGLLTIYEPPEDEVQMADAQAAPADANQTAPPVQQPPVPDPGAPPAATGPAATAPAQPSATPAPPNPGVQPPADAGETSDTGNASPPPSPQPTTPAAETSPTAPVGEPPGGANH